MVRAVAAPSLLFFFCRIEALICCLHYPQCTTQRVARQLMSSTYTDSSDVPRRPPEAVTVSVPAAWQPCCHLLLVWKKRFYFQTLLRKSVSRLFGLTVPFLTWFNVTGQLTFINGEYEERSVPSLPRRLTVTRYRSDSRLVRSPGSEEKMYFWLMRLIIKDERWSATSPLLQHAALESHEVHLLTEVQLRYFVVLLPLCVSEVSFGLWSECTVIDRSCVSTNNTSRFYNNTAV